jgi:hypothetical protein
MKTLNVVGIGLVIILVATVFSTTAAALTPLEWWDDGVKPHVTDPETIVDDVITVTGTTTKTTAAGFAGVILDVAEIAPGIARAWLEDKTRRDFLGSDFDFDDIDKLWAGS